MAGKVMFDRDRCKGCELCVRVCPRKIVAIDVSVTNARGYHPADVTDISRCTGCASCARMCPDSVITVERM